MLHHFFISFNAVAPLFLMILLGMGIKKMGLASPKTVVEMNSIVFHFLMPVLLCRNIGTATLEAALRPRLLLFTLISIPLIWLLCIRVISLFNQANQERGAIIQGICRSNFALFGLPLVSQLTTPEETSIAALLIVIVIPMYNVFAVILLEYYRDGKFSPRAILRGISRNPLILGTLAGVLWLASGVTLPVFLDAATQFIASSATPLALITLGAALTFGQRQKSQLPQLICGIAGRLVVIPLLTIPLGAALGFRGAEIAALLAIFASPTAVAAYTMGTAMGSDSNLSAAIVALTTLLSSFTVFIWIVVLLNFGLI
ncbi:MAG: AEC family transporter [Peptococcaceae bacterium]|jgi:predicted permease|nr:AEC family transporter [Peptococcaceae bacterium]